MARIPEWITDTNEQIAYLITQQTYDERLELAMWLCDALEHPNITHYVMCNLLGEWADAQGEPSRDD